MQRYFITLSYKGTHYHGWQIQENAVTVQEETEHCLSLILTEKIKLTGCGRTDTGVHARFFVAHFDIQKKLSKDEIQKILKKLNKLTSEALVFHQIFQVGENYHARFSAVERTYKYFILRKKMPFLKEFALLYSPELNMRQMQLACDLLCQCKDFTSFSKTGSNPTDNICNIKRSSWTYYPGGNILVFSITADRFLRNMVRAIVGTMLDIGLEKIPAADIKKIIESRNRSLAKNSIDAKGLFLWDVKYDNLTFDIPAFFIFPEH